MTLTLRPMQMLWLAGIAMAILAGVGMLWTFDPNVAGNPFLPCLFRTFTGYFCVGCGLTRAMHALVHGDVLRAFSLNPLAMLVLPLLPLMIAHGRGWQPRMLAPLMRWVMEPRVWLVLIPAYWIARNLPWYPFTLLAPA
ncbi:Protein of unknown function [Pseudoxanthomonas indica]|uniref:DUF2752 domain-containing protein n=1 Tax=Pseudoxanthomonas indica TaxID=428993 RepID=A0A1T5LBL6_9GAMM|nr:membrane protein [Pseudoxanthomonas indica]SKC73436.1 Protein of unknown function [Pseudoxanthomonas indica]